MSSCALSDSEIRKSACQLSIVSSVWCSAVDFGSDFTVKEGGPRRPVQV